MTGGTKSANTHAAMPSQLEEEERQLQLWLKHSVAVTRNQHTQEEIDTLQERIFAV